MPQVVYDCIVIGGGHNGLVAAAYLARGGRRVALVERRAQLGGAITTETGPGGAPLEIGAQDSSLFRPEIIRQLRLNLQLVRSPAPLFSLLPDGRSLSFWREPERAARAIAGFSDRDAEAYRRFARQVRKHAAVLEGTLHRIPPNLPTTGIWNTARTAWPWLGAAVRLRRLGARSMIEFIRSIPMDVASLLEERFERSEVQGALATSGLIGLMQGPRSAGTALMLLYQSIGGFPRGATFVLGGVAKLVEQLHLAAVRHGVELRSGTAVERVLTDDYAAVGVQLSSGEELRARAVASSTDARHTLFELVGAPQLELRVVRRVRNIRFRGSSARVNLLVNGLPQFRGVESTAELQGHLVLAPSLDYLERAFDDAKYGRISAEPHLTITVPTLHHADPAPDGKHVLAVTVRYAPYHLRSGDWPSQRQGLADQVVDLLGQYAPGLSARLIHRQVITPLDLETEYGLPEGDEHHGQMALDQLFFMRPIPGYAGYRSPVDGLYFCGAGAHPGGGLTGAPGRNAAMLILRDLARG